MLNLACSLQRKRGKRKLVAKAEQNPCNMGGEANIEIPKAAFTGLNLANREVDGVTTTQITHHRGSNAASLPNEIDFLDLFGRLGNNSDKSKELDDTIAYFIEEFLPGLQKRGKHKQLLAELKNLEHIKSCVNKMLSEDGLNFKPEFVAEIAIHRLNIAMFGFSIGEDISVERDQYEPTCMFDFGEDRSFANAAAGNYFKDGVPHSPDIKAGRRIAHSGSEFSFLRGARGRDGWSEDYAMPDGKRTSCLSRRFRQYLAHTTKDGDISNIDQNESVVDLPPAMMFLVGLQFGQNNIGSWNQFTLAAKKYLANQYDGDVDDFFWESDEQKDDIVNPFSHLYDGIGSEIYDRIDEDHFAKQFEIALCAYYAMNQEILSRVQFPGNDRQNCTIEEIFRLEGLDSLGKLEVVGTIEGDHGIAEWHADPRRYSRKCEEIHHRFIFCRRVRQ
jgi:hypothetical protein